MANLKSQVGDKEAAAIRKRLSLWARESNPICADCHRANPTWASVNLGVLVCLECAGRHRGLGVHISKMRSITLDTILPDEARFLINMSNVEANRWWEARLGAMDKAGAKASPSFIEQKYSLRKWVLQDASVPPPCPEMVPDSHPWWTTAQAATLQRTPPIPSPAPVPAPISFPILSRTREPPSKLNPAPLEHSNLIDLGGSSPTAAPQALASDTIDPFAAPVTATGPLAFPYDPFGSSDSAGDAAGSVSGKSKASQSGDPFVPLAASPIQVRTCSVAACCQHR
jgi:hypothetical protein